MVDDQGEGQVAAVAVALAGFSAVAVAGQSLKVGFSALPVSAHQTFALVSPHSRARTLQHKTET